MALNLENNIEFEIASGISSVSSVVSVKFGKEALLPTVPFRITLVKFDSLGVVVRREVVNVTNRVGAVCTITRAYEAVPINDSATTLTQVAYAFDEGDRAYMTVTAGMMKTMQTDIDSRLPKAGGTLTGAVLFAKGADMASSGTVNLATATGNIIHITGTNSISSFGTVTAGAEYSISFDASLTLAHNGTSFVLPGASNIVTTAGDVAYFRSEGSGNWRCTSYQKANGQAISSTTDINGLTAVTTVANADAFLEYNNAAGVNRKIVGKDLRRSMQKNGGTGTDGAVAGNASITITGSNNTTITKNYTSWAAGDGLNRAYTNDPAAGSSVVLNISDTSIFSVNDRVRVSSSAGTEYPKITAISTNVSITVDTLALNHTTSSPLVTKMRVFTITPTNCNLHIKVNGDANLLNWYFDFEGKGGQNGTTYGLPFVNIVPNAGHGALSDTNGGAGATSNLSMNPNTPTGFIGSKVIMVSPGSAGGAGGGGYSAGGGAGGFGGGSFIFEVFGNLTMDSGSTAFAINLKGTAGSNSSSNTGGGGGGGGAGGVGVFIYGGTLTGSNPGIVTGGAGGTGSLTPAQGSGVWTGGGGGGGSSVYAVGSTGGNGIASNASTGQSGATGGAGANGQILYISNQDIA